MILECIPHRNTDIGKKYLWYLNRLQEQNPVSGELLKRRVTDIRTLIKHKLNENK